jgi:ribosomal protein S8
MFNIHLAAKRLTFNLLFTKKIFNIVKLLTKLGLFLNFYLFKKNNYIYIKIFIRYYYLKKVGSIFKIITRPSLSYSLSLKALKLLTKRTGRSVYLLSTGSGIITHHEAVQKNIGGVALAFLSL